MNQRFFIQFKKQTMVKQWSMLIQNYIKNQKKIKETAYNIGFAKAGVEGIIEDFR